jgi:hypothetical protein
MLGYFVSGNTYDLQFSGWGLFGNIAPMGSSDSNFKILLYKLFPRT